MQHINKHIHINSFALSPVAENIIKKVWTELHEASKLKPIVKSLPKVSNKSLSPLIPKPIQEYIIANPMHQTSVELTVESRKYTLHFYTVKKVNLDSHIKKINTWLHVASKYAEARCSQQVIAHIYLTPIRKLLPKSREQDIKEEHANTAFTTSCMPNTEIVLFREEEWFKVFVHESFHNLGLDFSEYYHETNGRKLLQTLFPIKSEFRLFEVYCEMWAELINLLVLEPEYNIKKIENAIQCERKFSLFQAAKILDFYGHNYEDLFGANEYKENTEVFCYYILKSLLMYNCNTFLEFCRNGLLFKANATVEAFINKLIVPHYKDSAYIESIDDTQKYFDVPRKSFIGTTMRMSIAGIQCEQS